MPSRYYFLSSLPMLRFSDGAPLTWDAFLYQAKGNISDADYALLENLDCEEPKNAFLKKWKAFNEQLSGAVNARRRSLLGRPRKTGDGESLPFEVEKVASQAMGAKDPLEAETVLMQCRYQFLEEQIGSDMFSRTALLAYALQLKILLRKDLFSREAGNAEYQRMFSVLQKEMKME